MVFVAEFVHVGLAGQLVGRVRLKQRTCDLQVELSELGAENVYGQADCRLLQKVLKLAGQRFYFLHCVLLYVLHQNVHIQFLVEAVVAENLGSQNVDKKVDV